MQVSASSDEPAYGFPPTSDAPSSFAAPSSRGPRSVASGATTNCSDSSVGSAFGGGGGGGNGPYLMCLNVSPTQVLLDSFAKLHAQGRVCRGKTLAVMYVRVYVCIHT